MIKICGTCINWNGDKTKYKSMLEDNPLSMDLKNGWPNTGSCIIQHEWLSVEIYGDAAVSIQIDANFSCIHFSEV